MAKSLRAGTIAKDEEMEQRAAELYKDGYDPVKKKEWSGKGLVDLHVHADRAFTEDDVYFEHEGGIAQFRDAPLVLKQDAVGVIHRGLAFTRTSLYARMDYLFAQKTAEGEKEVWAICDCSPDIGDLSFTVARELKKKYAGTLDVKVGAYPIFGFKSYTSKEGKARIGLISDLASQADFLVGLPERDARPDHAEIGFKGHLVTLIKLAVKHQIPLQVHVDQTGRPNEIGTKTFIQAVDWLVTNSVRAARRPRMIAVHVISPSAYAEPEFVEVVRGFRTNDIELCACVHAAASMRPPRQYAAPLHNLVARILEMRLAGVPVSLGTDNVCDIMMPRPVSPLLTRELDIFASHLRYYDEGIIYKIARGEAFNNSDYLALKRHLELNYDAWDMPQGVDALLATNPAFLGS